MSGALPPGACDSHCHIFGPAAIFPFAPGAAYTPADAPKEELFTLHRRLGLDRAVIVQGACHGFDHGALCDALKNAGGSHRGVALLPEDVTETQISDMHAAGIRGVRFNFVPRLGAPPSDSFVAHVADLVEPLGWHFSIHLLAADLERVTPLLRSLDLPLVIDHMARIEVRGAEEPLGFDRLLALLENPLIHVKLSAADRASAAGPPFGDVTSYMRRLIEAAPDRVVWGTDWPHPNVRGTAPRDDDMLALLHRAAPEPGVLRAILVDNPERIFDFEFRSEPMKLAST